MQVSGIVQAPSSTSAADTTQPIVLMGKQAEVIDTNLHGKYYTQAYRLNSFIGNTTAAGIVPPTYSSTAQLFGLWNPAGNTKNAVLASLDMAVVTVGSLTTSSACLALLANAGSGLATPISAFTATTPVSANVGQNVPGNTVRFTLSATVTAPVFLFTLPFAIWSTTSALAGSMPCLHYDFDSGIIIPPNTAVFVCGNVNMVSSYNISLRWYETPV